MPGAKEAEYRALLQRFLPENAIDRVLQTLEEYKVQLKITRQRKGKLGDYRFDERWSCHRISINYNLGQYHFLITLLHEFAHMLVKERCKYRPMPHGPEWKSAFREIAGPYLTEGIFPEEITRAFATHLQKGKASTSTDPQLAAALLTQSGVTGTLTLDRLDIGTEFRFKDKHFRKMEKRRTRYLCYCLSDKRTYLISPAAPIEPVLSDN
jgi:hypothetical protein